MNGSSGETVITRIPWRSRLGRWALAFGVLCLAYQLYAFLVVPWVEPSVATRAASHVFRSGQSTGDSHPELAQLFPPEAWERNDPMVLETDGGMLLFQDYQTADDGKLVLSPCTVVFFSQLPNKSGSSPGKAESNRNPTGGRPIVLKAPERAVLNFSGSLNLGRAEFGKLKGALLEGEITIFSPPTAPDVDDGLFIVTRNVQILPNQIWTPHDVQLRYGENRGSGRDLSIKLASQEDDEKPESGNSLVNAVESLELVHVDRLSFLLPSSQLEESEKPDRSAADRQVFAVTEDDAENIPVEITCHGPFQFDFQNWVASFEDHVDVIRVNRQAAEDRLNCQQLKIYFDPADPADTSEQSPGEPVAQAPPRSSSPKPRRIVAIGLPAVLQAPTWQTSAHGHRLEYDFHTRRILLEDDQRAEFTHRQHHVVSPKLEYEMSAEPLQLGRLWASGPGNYRGATDGEDRKSIEAAWSGQLRLQPQDGLHVMSILDGAEMTLRQPSVDEAGAPGAVQIVGQFAAKKLFLWLANVEGVAPSTPETDPPDKQIRPVKMLADGQVTVKSPQLNGDTQRLEVWFDHPPAPRPNPASTSLVLAQPNREATSDGRRSGLPLSEPPPTEPQSPWSTTNDRQYEFHGGLVRLRILMAEDEPQIREATVTEQVRLTQRDGRSGQQTLMITGQTLQLRMDQLRRAAVDIHGSPARVMAEQTLLEGAALHVSQRENRMWADGPGRMRLPSQSPGAKQAMPSQVPLWVSWQGGMDFNGQVARFLRKVEVRGVNKLNNGNSVHFVGLGEQLHAKMNRYVEMQRSPQSTDLEVIEIRFLGDVHVENQTFEPTGAIASHDHMQIRDFVLDRPSGKFHALGPGWIISRHVDNGTLAKSLGTAQSSSAPGDGAPQLSYLRVDFENGVAGDIYRREVEFGDFVRTVYGPIASWSAVLDPDNPAGIGPQGMILTCQRMIIAQMGQAGLQSLELKALGNTHVESAEFTARGDRLSYSAAKDQLILEGIGRSFAVLEQRVLPGQRPSGSVAQKIIYFPRSGLMEVEGGRSIDYSHFSSPTAQSPQLRSSVPTRNVRQ
jgi:hypothetical protein